MIKKLLTGAIATLSILSANTASAVAVSTSDGIINSTAGTASYGEAGSYMSGGGGLTGKGTTWPLDIGDGISNVSGEASDANQYWLNYNVSDPLSADAIKYQFDGSYSQVIAVAGVDHGPSPYESLEMILWGWTGSTWEEGSITAIYDQGVDASWLYDDFSSVWSFDNAYSLFAVTGGTHYTGPGAGGGFEGEIDAVVAFVAVPEPTTYLLIGLGLVGIGYASRKRKQTLTAQNLNI